MELNIKYRGRVATTYDIELINRLIAKCPGDSRRALSVKFCKVTNWVQANGALRDMVCRGYMLALYRAGYIKLPEKKYNTHNPLANRKKPNVVDIDKTAINTNLKSILPLEFIQVRRSKLEKLFNSLISQYHYLGYVQPVGEHLKYMVYAANRPIACIALSSAPRHIGPRDTFIGWDANLRRKNIHLICYNIRFLILPWIRIPYLASHILSRIARIISNDWNKLYNHPVYYIETFVDKQKFKGTCYRAANWQFLGDTKGLGKDSKNKIPNRSIKAIYGYPLSKDFRKVLLGDNS
ncbi:MAG: Druantia anti-phage system protein DruA [Candidatus Humimicrobiaceae bacterium]